MSIRPQLRRVTPRLLVPVARHICLDLPACHSRLAPSFPCHVWSVVEFSFSAARQLITQRSLVQVQPAQSHRQERSPSRLAVPGSAQQRLPRTSTSTLGGGRRSDAFGGRLAEAMGREYISFGGLETGQQNSTGRAEPGRTSHAPL